MNKEIFFYSNFCKYSQDLIQYIIKKDLKKHFVFVCVDTNKHRIPSQIDKVPALFLTQSGQVLFGEDILSCIETNVQEITPNEQPSSTFSDNFSFLGDDDSMVGNSSCFSKNFSSVDADLRIYTPQDDDGKKDNEMSLERYNNQRERDVSSIFGDRQQRA